MFPNVEWAIIVKLLTLWLGHNLVQGSIWARQAEDRQQSLAETDDISMSEIELFPPIKAGGDGRLVCLNTSSIEHERPYLENK